MKLIIDIPEEEYKRMTEMSIYSTHAMICAIQNRIPLDDVKAEIEANMYCDKDTRLVKNANASGLEKAIEILDNIGKAEKDFPQPEDIEPTVKGFADTMNRWGNLVEKGGE